MGTVAPTDWPAVPEGLSRVLLEREEELSEIRSLLDGALAGEPGLGLVEGPTGIGKTRLLAEARALAQRRGFEVLWGRGGEIERELSFGVTRQLFGMPADAAAESDGDRRVPGVRAALETSEPVRRRRRVVWILGSPVLAHGQAQRGSAAGVDRRRPALV